jgi:hypothetical protein
MPERSWFYAAGGQQQGPYGETQFRDLVARGAVTAETLVWTEGMTGWQRAADVPGLLSAASRPPVVPRSAGAVMGGRSYGGGAISVDFEILEFTWRTLAFVFGSILVIPAPWLFVWYVSWLVPCVHVPGRPNLSFTGRALTLAPWYFGAIVLAVVLGLIGERVLNNLMTVAEIVLYWLLLRWLIANIASNGQPLGLSFSGPVWTFLGWNILLGLSFLTIIGWAWVYTAQMRWICRNIQGTRREIVFKARGLDYLWRALVLVIASAFIIPIPWVARWFMQWQASQTELVERGTLSGV